jgi:putative tryptophan/tyrosine transport system substrate-binding protein
VHTPADIETAISSLGRQPDSGLIVAPDTFTVTNGQLIVSLTAKYHLPAVYGFNGFSETGALLSYGPDYHDAVRRAASYVDRILRGEKPAELPVQAPVKFKTILNVPTAKALGLTVPPGVLVAADEVIE